MYKPINKLQHTFLDFNPPPSGSAKVSDDKKEEESLKQKSSGKPIKKQCH